MDSSWLDALESRAAEVLPAAVHAYVRAGARDGLAAAEAVEAWRALRLRPRVLQDVRAVDTRTTACGVPLDLPVAVAPTTLQRAADPDGEIAMARAVADSGSLLVVSSNAGHRLADIAATGVAWWLQAYLPQRRDRARALLADAVAAGASAVVLTVDTPVVGTKYGAAAGVWDAVDVSWVRANLADAADDPKATDLGPDDIAWLADTTGLPVVVKGVLRADDARRCVEAGAAAIWVSNHGGRQLDRAATTAACLPDIVEAVGEVAQAGGTEVYVDGGLRNGLDLLAALGLGTRLAFVGRQPFYALAVSGADGVRRMFAEMRAEIEEGMRLLGVADLATLRRSEVVLGRAREAATRAVPGVDLRERPL